MIDGKVILVTGGTGSFGSTFLREVLKHDVKAVRVYSRDELKQSELAQQVDDERLRLLLGDVRDLERLTLASKGVDAIIHAAALKHVPVCEYNPFEAVQTNIIGAQNVVTAAIANNIPRTLALSSDKAVNPVNLYGATKLCAEKIISQANAYATDSPARFSTVRYGNVIGSRGSVIPLFRKQAEEGEITITDEAMTRFWMTLDHSVRFVLECLGCMKGGEVFVPKMPSMRITELAKAIAPGGIQRITGIRPGEKIHETLVTADESRHAVDCGDHFEIRPAFHSWRADYLPGDELPPDFFYSSDTNPDWLTADELSHRIDPIREAQPEPSG